MSKERFRETYTEKREKMVDTLLRCVQYIDEDQLELLPNDRSINLLKEYGLKLYQDAQSLAYWPLFLDNDTIDKQNITINVCSCAFGALSLNNMLETDEKKWYFLSETINRAINSLIILQAEDGSWPSSWEVADNSITSGNVNQTTLSISTLFRCGFFNEKSSIGIESISVEQREKRYSLLIRSLQWLINAKKEINPDEVGWYFTNYNDNTTSIMVSSFVYDVFMKTLKCMESNNEMHDYFMNEVPGVINTIYELVKKTDNYCCRRQNSDGGYSRSYGRVNKEESNILDTCYALNVLGYIDKDSETQVDVTDQIKQAIGYIKDKFSLRAIEDKVIVRFSYIENRISLKTKKAVSIDRIEEYEIYPYTLLIMALISLFKGEERQYKKFSRVFYKLFRELDDRCIVDDRKLFLAKGNRSAPGQNFPIYALYYAMYSYDLYIKNKDYIVFNRGLNYNPYVLTAVLLLLSVISFILFTTDSIFFIISSVLMYLFGILIKNWKK